METGAITGYVDVAQLVLYAFWAFFAGLIYYLVRENHREGYPMDPGPNSDAKVTGWPVAPTKHYHLSDGKVVPIPNPGRLDLPAALPMAQLSGAGGAPFEPTGNPMLDGVGPGSWAPRADVVEHTSAGDPKLFPIRTRPEYGVGAIGRDPRGMPVIGADGEIGGTVVDLWLDGAESIFRYLEVAVPGAARNVLLPFNFARVNRDHVAVNSVLAAHFATVPVTRDPTTVTLLEEEKIVAYFGGGTLYADPRRVEPLL
jgi:photosynthetic reaction center H subunit